MYQFFVDPQQVEEKQIRIEGSDVNHIGNVLRMKPGEKIRISDGTGKSYFCHIREIHPQLVLADIDEADRTGTELPLEVTLYQGLPKSDKMELIIQKAVELGASRIVPVSMKNCVAKLDEKKAVGRVQRWQAIAESAAKQSKRTKIPEVALPMNWKQALAQAGDLDLVIVPYENERGMEATREAIASMRGMARVGIMIGPEGGFADSEIAMVDDRYPQMKRVSLGKRILRTETAGLAALAMMIYELENE